MKSKRWYSIKNWKEIPRSLYPVACCILILVAMGIVSADMKFARK